MAKLIKLPNFKDQRGNLTVIEKLLPFDIKRVYYIYNCDGSVRGNHMHKKNRQAVVCLKGNVNFYCQGKNKKTIKYQLNDPNLCLLVEPTDFHWFDNFSSDTIILVLASEYFDQDDYIFDNN